MSAIVLDQASRLRSLMNADPAATAAAPLPERAARVIAVASGKGGVGKTSICVNLAIRLADCGHRVALVDADLGTANVDVLLNLQAPFGLADVVSGRRTLDDVAVQYRKNICIVMGASGLPRVADLDQVQRSRIIDQLSLLERQQDIILLDCGAGISENVLAFAQAVRELILVTTPEPTAITDAYALLKVLCLAKTTPDVRMVVNQARSFEDGQETYERIAGVAARFLGIAVGSWGHILRDDHVAKAVYSQSAFVLRHPGCPASTCIAALAERVAAQSPGGSKSPGFFRRALAFFH